MCRHPALALTIGWVGCILMFSHCVIIFAWFLPKRRLYIFTRQIWGKRYYFSPEITCDDLGQYVQSFLKFYLKSYLISYLWVSVVLFVWGKKWDLLSLVSLAGCYLNFRPCIKTYSVVHRWLEWSNLELKVTAVSHYLGGYVLRPWVDVWNCGWYWTPRIWQLLK